MQKNTLRAVIHTVNCNKKQNKFIIDTEWQSRAAKQLKHLPALKKHEMLSPGC